MTRGNVSASSQYQRMSVKLRTHARDSRHIAR
jgi:hypothetical protein